MISPHPTSAAWSKRDPPVPPVDPLLSEPLVTEHHFNRLRALEQARHLRIEPLRPDQVAEAAGAL